MRIRSTDQKAWLEISRNADETYSSFAIGCSVEIGHGSFEARNSQVQFLNIEEFVEDLGAFILDRKLVPQLRGTYDTGLKFYQPDGKNIVMVGFIIGDAFAGPSQTVRYRTEGEFEVDAEYLNGLVSGFRKLSAGV